MKKILFTLLLVAGSFGAQAQDSSDYLRYFRFASSENATQDRSHLFSDDVNHCAARLDNAGIIVDYTYNRTTRQVYVKNGDEAVVALGSPLSSRQGIGLATTFDRTNLSQVFTTGSRGNVTGEITGFTVQ